MHQAFTKLIADRIGLTLRKSEQETFKAFIINRLSPLGFSRPEEYYLLLNAATDEAYREWEGLITEITNTESFFFRDKGQFKLLKNYILPDIIERKLAQTPARKSLRICSAGCSTGEEAYSIAIVLKSLLPDLKDWELKVIGIDINPVAIKKAQKGLYRPWSFRGMNPDLQSRFFRQEKNQYQLHGEIMELVDFKIGNLVDSTYINPFLEITKMDLILCRNVFIYFSAAAIEKTIAKFYNALAPSGYLLVGHTELHSQPSNRFDIKMFDESIAYQRPMDETAAPTSEFLTIPDATNAQPTQDNTDPGLDTLLNNNSIKMNQVALNLLRQLPSDSRLAKLGNRTAAELIAQIENTLEETP